MTGFIEGVQRGQVALFPDRLEDWIGEDGLVRIVDLFVDELDLPDFGFGRAIAAKTGRPGYHPAVLLKLFTYGYLNRIRWGPSPAYMDSMWRVEAAIPLRPTHQSAENTGWDRITCGNHLGSQFPPREHCHRF